MALSSQFVPPGMGWQRDLPDPRDLTPDRKPIRQLLLRLPPADDSCSAKRIDQSSHSDFAFLTAPGDQQELNSSTAFAVLSLIEYFERRMSGRNFGGSRLFLYQMTRRLLRSSGNCAVGLRGTLKAFVRFGVPPEDLCPYDSSRLDDPSTDVSLLGYARDFAGIHYTRLDKSNTKGEETLATVKSFINAGFPVVFGFPVPGSLTRDGEIPYMPTFDNYHGGQAALAVGYDDHHPGGARGALLVRSSWGVDWGDEGYGWLPYAYVTSQLAVDFWTVVRDGWIQSGELHRPACIVPGPDCDDGRTSYGTACGQR